MITVELYTNLKLGLAPTVPSEDLTPLLRKVEWSHAVDARGVRATVVLETSALHRAATFGDDVLKKAAGKIRQQSVGSYIVIRDASSLFGEALWWGRVQRIRYNSRVSETGILLDEPIVLECESWLSVLMQSSIVPAASTPGVGAFIPGALLAPGGPTGLSAYYKLAALAIQAQANAPGGVSFIGTALAALWELFAKNGVFPAALLGSVGANLPEGDGFPGLQEIGNALLAGVPIPNKINSMRRIPVVWSRELAALHTPSRAANMTPVPGWSLNAVSSQVPRGSIWSFLQGTFGADPNLVEFFPSLEPAVPGVPANPVMPGLGGATPTLIYRMKPLVETVPVTGARTLLFPGPNNAPSPYTIEASDILSLSTVFDDAERINGWFLHSPYMPRSQMKVLGGWCNPIFDSYSANVHGLRYYEANWPFYPGSGAAEAQFSDKMSAIVEYAYNISEGGEDRPSGQMRLRYKPELRAGNWYIVRFLDGRGLPGIYTVYAQSASHVVTVDRATGVQSGRSSVSFIRAKGLLDVPSTPPVSIPALPVPGVTP